MELKKEPGAGTPGGDKTALIKKFFQEPYYPKAEDFSILIEISESHQNPMVQSLAKAVIRQLEEKGMVAA